MTKDLQLGQKLGMSLDDLIQKTRKEKGSADSKAKKPAAKKPAAKQPPAKKAANAKPDSKKLARQTKNTLKPKKTGPAAIKKAGAQAPKVVANAVKPGGVKNPGTAKKGGVVGGTRGAPAPAPRPTSAKEARVADLLKMKSKKEAQKAIKIARQLEAEARKILGPASTNTGQQRPAHAPQHGRAAHPQQQRHVAHPQQRGRAAHSQQQRHAAPPQQQTRAPPRPQQHARAARQQQYVPQEESLIRAPYWQGPQTQNFLHDDDRMTDSEHMDDMGGEPRDVKPSLAEINAHSHEFMRGVRGQSRR